MNGVQVPADVLAEIQYHVDDGVIDEIEAQRLIARERARWQLLAALLEINDWIHDALFIKSQYLTEVPEVEE